MAGPIGVAVVLIVVTQWFGVFDKLSIFFGEIVVTAAFGLSWLLKGWDRNVWPKMTKW
jgi:hypothetical protein